MVLGARVVSRAISNEPQLVSTLAVAGPRSAEVGGESCTAFGAGVCTPVQPAGNSAAEELSPPPLPHPESTDSARLAATAVRAVIKALEGYPGRLR